MNREPESVDLTALDPERDPERWGQVVQATRFRVGAVVRDRAGRADPVEVLAGWARPVLATAAALVILLGAVDAVITSPEVATVGDARRLARLSEHAVLHGRAPSGAELLAAIRAGHTP